MAWRSEYANEDYLRQVESSQSAISCYFSGHIQGDDVSHPLHLMDDSIGVGHGVSVTRAWQPPLSNHSINLRVYFLCKKTGGQAYSAFL